MNEAQPPGWYYAAGDPPGTQRYWDGELWQGNPQPLPQAAPPPGGGAAYPGYPAQQIYPESSQATTALVLSILSLVLCGLLAPIGWNIGQKELDGIDAGRRDPSNRGTANAAKVIGIVVTALMVLGLLLVVGFVIVAASSSA